MIGLLLLLCKYIIQNVTGTRQHLGSAEYLQNGILGHISQRSVSSDIYWK
jgi:hypothetical protein